MDSIVEVAKRFGARVCQRRPWGYADPDRMFALKKPLMNGYYILMTTRDYAKSLKII
ncbi:MAG: hypothetical protein QXP55_01355 [Nitrososphaerales archaeon]